MTIIQIDPLETGQHPIQSQSGRRACWLEGYIEVPAHLHDAVWATYGWCDLQIEGDKLVGITPTERPPEPEPEPQPEIIDQNALISYGISYGQSRGMIYTPSLPSEIHGYDPPSDFMLWVTSMEEAKAKVRECIDCTVDNILSLEPGTSPSDIRFYVCFNSSNQFVVMYG